mmetsp:Transcript_110828/g.357743  ORF Transcript_110828/g.357743 Transcript_110828/m.357743 type:complete len:284 (-) Transcript_110828:144-995(-)
MMMMNWRPLASRRRMTSYRLCRRRFPMGPCQWTLRSWGVSWWRLPPGAWAPLRRGTHAPRVALRPALTVAVLRGGGLMRWHSQTRRLPLQSASWNHSSAHSSGACGSTARVMEALPTQRSRKRPQEGTRPQQASPSNVKPLGQEMTLQQRRWPRDGLQSSRNCAPWPRGWTRPSPKQRAATWRRLSAQGCGAPACQGLRSGWLTGRRPRSTARWATCGARWMTSMPSSAQCRAARLCARLRRGPLLWPCRWRRAGLQPRSASRTCTSVSAWKPREAKARSTWT